MNIQWIKKGLAGTALALILGIGSTTVLSTTAQAQDRRWRDRDNRSDRDRDYRSDRGREAARRQAEREREWAYRQRQNNRYVYVTPRVVPRVYNGGGYYGGYGNNGGYGNYGSSYEEQRGFSDGLNRGQEDVRDRRSFNPNNSSHYRSGNSAYREGFRRGYAQGYRQYGGYGRY